MNKNSFTIENIGDFLKEISHTQEHTTLKPIYCFRGESKDFGNTSLTPGIFRKDKFSYGLEKKILSVFINNGYDLISPHLKSDVEKLIIGQHHGLPTRFLDWTLNPLMALFFALEDTANNNEDACVYALPLELHLSRCDIQKMSITDINSLEQQKISIFYVSNICPRIKSQNGLLSIHFPNDKSAMNLLGLHKFIIPNRCKPIIKKELSICNITEKTVYTNLDNLAKNIKEEYY